MNGEHVWHYVHGAMGHRIDPSWGGPIKLFLIPASAPVAMGRRINPSWGGPIMLFLIPASAPVCGMMHIKEPLLLIGMSSLSEWSSSICVTPYNRK